MYENMTLYIHSIISFLRLRKIDVSYKKTKQKIDKYLDVKQYKKKQ
jgi:hypothetical protein